MKTKPAEAVAVAPVASKSKEEGGKVVKHQTHGGHNSGPDPNKEWSNGHKCFNSAQHRAFVELLHTEERTRNTYDNVRDKLSRPRNPLNGDITPRDPRGTLVMNPRLLYTVKDGIPLFDPKNASPTREYHPPRIVGKIGVQSGKYDVLGNTSEGVSPANEHGDQFDLFKTTRLEAERKAAMRMEQEKMNEFVLREKAKRHEKELGRQMVMLQRKLEEKNKEMDILRNTFKV